MNNSIRDCLDREYGRREMGGVRRKPIVARTSYKEYLIGVMSVTEEDSARQKLDLARRIAPLCNELNLIFNKAISM